MTAPFNPVITPKMHLAADAVQGVLTAFCLERHEDLYVLAETAINVLLGEYDGRERVEALKSWHSLTETMLHESLGRIDASAGLAKRERRSQGNVTELQPGMLP